MTAQAKTQGGLIGPAVVAAVGLAVLLALGTWQLQRMAWKQGLIAALEARLAAAPVPLPPAAGWPRLAADADEFRRVAFTASFAHDQEALVYTAGSSLRTDVSGPGYWVFTPARLGDGTTVMVNRGFVAQGRQDPATRGDGQVAGSVAITGVLRWPEAAGAFTPAASPKDNLWFSRDPAAIASAKGAGEVAPFYVDQEGPVPPGGLPRPGRLTPTLPNNHFGYMLTWYGLAGALVAVFAAWAKGRRRRAQAGG